MVQLHDLSQIPLELKGPKLIIPLFTLLPWILYPSAGLSLLSLRCPLEAMSSDAYAQASEGHP